MPHRATPRKELMRNEVLSCRHLPPEVREPFPSPATHSAKGEKNLKIVPFEELHISQASELFLAAYRKERAAVPALPPIRSVPVLQSCAGNRLGVAAFENDRMVGYLCCVGPFEQAFRSTDARGVFSPFGANAAASDDPAAVYAAMYQAAAAKWVKLGAVSHGICLPAHDHAAQQQFFRYGFGLRCADAIRTMEPIPGKTPAGYTLRELPKEEWMAVYPLELALNKHYRQSPFFMNRAQNTPEEFLTESTLQNARYFAAMQGDALCAYLKITFEGETFVAQGEGYCHVHGAYCLPAHRGNGLYRALLGYAASGLRKDGCTRLGVDFESINPNAWGFWRKDFAVYTHSVVRRIDERILQG